VIGFFNFPPVPTGLTDYNNMDTESLLLKIIDLPDQFNKVRNKSIITLLKESGYVELFGNVNEDNIAELLSKYPEKINYWLIWSDDKRSRSGWYFIKENENLFKIGYLPRDKEVVELKYSNKILACAAYIKLELEDIRLNC
jgi:hypothetical protein